MEWLIRVKDQRSLNGWTVTIRIIRNMTNATWMPLKLKVWMSDLFQVSDGSAVKTVFQTSLLTHFIITILVVLRVCISCSGLCKLMSMNIWSVASELYENNRIWKQSNLKTIESALICATLCYKCSSVCFATAAPPHFHCAYWHCLNFSLLYKKK